MDLRINISLSDENFINSIESAVAVKGCGLKKYSLKKWIYGNGYSQPYIARRMGLQPEVFKLKLRNREIFYKDEIWELIKLMHAKEAYKVIYFQTNRQRKRVWWQVFGKYGETERLNE